MGPVLTIFPPQAVGTSKEPLLVPPFLRWVAPAPGPGPPPAAPLSIEKDCARKVHMSS